MKKVLVKRILKIIDIIEIQGVHLDKATEIIMQFQKKDNEYDDIIQSDVENILNFCLHRKILKITHRGIDLTPPATIFSKSDAYSICESLAFFECLLNQRNLYNFYNALIKDNPFIHRQVIQNQISDDATYQILMQTCFYEAQDQDYFRINSLLIMDVENILNEYDQIPLISHTLLALYTSIIIHHDDISIEYRNHQLEMINYLDKQIILDVLPRGGIPHNRDETKSLQAFFKDTLFHEFNHQCALCGVDLSKMLIASHIKPFRDCAHIFECSDHDNGLLLCRNHDYLFDQGYISFDQNGTILISDELLNKENLEDSFNIHEDDYLRNNYLSYERKLFLKYHQDYIFRK